MNELLEAEAEKLIQAAQYECNELRQGHYSRNLTTTFGGVTLKVPRLKGISFETVICHQRELGKRGRPRRDDGTLERVFHALSADADMENLSMGSTYVKVHESANSREKTADKAIGRTRGGLNTKLYTIVDGLGNPVTFLLSAGNDLDSTHAIQLLEQINI